MTPPLRSRSGRIDWMFLGIAAGVLLVLVVVAAFLAYPQGKKVLAHIRLEESREATEAGDLDLAYNKAKSAERWRPDSEAIQLERARTAVAYSHEEATELWPKAVDLPGRTPEDLKAFLEFALGFNNPRNPEQNQVNRENFRRFIGKLTDELPDDPEVVLMQVSDLKERRRIFEGIIAAQPLIDQGVDHVALQREYVSLLLLVPQEDFRERARDHLLSLAEEDTATGLMALEVLVRQDLLSEGERGTFARQLRDHPMAGREEILLAYRFLLATSQSTFEEARERIEPLFELEDTLEDQQSYAQWLLTNRRPDLLLETFDRETAEFDPTLFYLWLIAKVTVGEAQEVVEITYQSADRNPLSFARNLVIRAQAYEVLGQVRQAQESFTNLVENGSLEQVMLIRQELRRRGDWPNLLKLYQRLPESTLPGYQELGRRWLLEAYYVLGREDDLLEILDKISYEDYEDEPMQQNLLAYLNLLYRRDLGPHKSKVEELLSDYPTAVDFRLTLALAYLREDASEEAFELVERLPNFDAATPRYLRVISSAILAANGEREAALQRLGPIAMDNLLPAERDLLSSI